MGLVSPWLSIVGFDGLAVGGAVEAENIERVRVRGEFRHATQRRERSLEIVRQRRAQVEHRSRQRMTEAKPGCMEEVTLRRQRGQSPATPTSIGIVTYHRMPNRRDVNTDLVRASAVQVRAQEVH